MNKSSPRYLLVGLMAFLMAASTPIGGVDGATSGVVKEQESSFSVLPERKDYLGTLGLVVKVINGEDGHGSGVIVSSNQVVTNAHVVASVKKDTKFYIKLESSETRLYNAKILKVYEERDLALLEVEGITFERFAKTLDTLARVSFLDDIWAIGFPLTLNKALTKGTYQGKIEALSDYGKVFSFLVVTSSIAPGNSGGGVFIKVDNQVWLLGIPSGVAFAPQEKGGRDVFPNIVYVVPGPEIANFLK